MIVFGQMWARAKTIINYHALKKEVIDSEFKSD